MSKGPPPWELLPERGFGAYDREPITQLEHGLQAAALAATEGATEPLQLAALFHDVGHLLHPDATAASLADVDDRHEDIGARYLAKWFGPDVAQPVALHVAAKRFLTRDPEYKARLSAESAHSLEMQGGPFDDAASISFLETPFAAQALAVRRWDDLAKDPDAVVPQMDHWTEVAKRVAGL